MGAFLDRRLQLGARSGKHLARVDDFLDVGTGAEPAGDATAIVAHRMRAAHHPAIIAAVMAQPIFDLIGLAGRQRMRPACPGAFLILWMEHVVPPFAIGRSVRRAGIFVPAVVVIIVIAVGPGRPDHLFDRIDDPAELCFAVDQRADRLDAFDRIPADFGDPFDEGDFLVGPVARRCLADIEAGDPASVAKQRDADPSGRKPRERGIAVQWIVGGVANDDRFAQRILVAHRAAHRPRGDGAGDRG